MNAIYKDINAKGQEKIEFVRSFFPELDDCNIKFTRLSPESCYAGYCNWDKNTIRLQENILMLNGVIAHELTHMASHHCGGIPKGERACDLWTLARSSILNDIPPYYLRIPMSIKQNWTKDIASSLSVMALNAIQERELGKCHYLKAFEESVGICNYLASIFKISISAVPSEGVSHEQKKEQN